jgi:hypothetical protein
LGPSFGVDDVTETVVVAVGVVADAVGLVGEWVDEAMAASKGLISRCNRPDLASALGVVWSCGPVGHNFIALDLRNLWTAQKASWPSGELQA